MAMTLNPPDPMIAQYMAQHPMHAVVAPLGPPPKPLSMADMAGMGDQAMPTMSTQAPQVRGMTPLEQYQDSEGKRMTADLGKDANPYGSPTNHPGVLGKFLHGLSVATGGPNRRQFEEENLGKQLEGEQKEQSAEGLQNATAEHTRAETPEVAPNAESLRALQGAETGHAGAETTALENPAEEWKAIPGVIGPNGEAVEIGSRSGQIRMGGSGITKQSQARPDTPEQQYIDEYQRLHQGSTIADAERAYTADTQRAPQAIMLTPGQNGTYTAQNVHPGSQVQPGSISPGGLNSLDVPTTQQRNVAAQAKLVTAQMPSLVWKFKKTLASWDRWLDDGTNLCKGRWASTIPKWQGSGLIC